MNQSRYKSKLPDRQKLDSFNTPAESGMDGGIDYLSSPQRLREGDYANHVHSLGNRSVQIRMPNVHSKKLVSVVSSRIGKNTDRKSNWFDAIRTLAVQQRNQNLCVLTAPGTTTFPYLCRLSELFGWTLILLTQSTHQSPQNQSRSKKGCPLLNFPDARVLHAFYDWQHKGNVQADCNPNVDQLMINIAEECFAISVRKNGTVHEALKTRLQKVVSNRTRLLINRQLTPQRVSVELTNLGAIPWCLYDQRQLKRPPQPSQRTYGSSHRRKPAILSKSATPKTRVTPPREDRRFLIHWTRQSTGPWPDQPYREFLDDLLFRSPTRGEGGLSTLKRILTQQKIRGSHKLTKGKEKVTCLTSVPLSQYANRRIFRSHLSRWDFEHYGIAIDCDFLKKLGARKVNYGTKSDWNRLCKLDRPFFQLQTTTNIAIDWRAEKEWRIRGDLDLQSIPKQMAFVFVKTNSERADLQKQSRWPVVPVEALKNLNRQH
ncbi:MAG: hypothetical protein GY748_00890 [Planctomycetaceae bacterium]|nr:hypothetical protein [Planctomycetaceae bacterium]